jgi:hypothetical protein
MAGTGLWMIKLGTTPVTDVTTAGIQDVILTRKLDGADTLNFRLIENIDVMPIVAAKQNVVITDPTGVQRFVGRVTKIPLKGNGTAEEQQYECEGPWWYFEHLVFQMIWQIFNAVLVPPALVSTLRTTIIIGQADDGTKIDLGAVATAVLNYILSTAAAVGLPAPFQLGTMTPTTIIPFSQVDNRTCAQLIEDFFAWVPDVIKAFDYSTTPPTLNFTQRGLATTVALQAYNGIVSDIDLTPRDDLVVPAVIVKYVQTFDNDGETMTQIVPDIYPVGAVDPNFDNAVFECNLIGGSMAFLKAPIKTTDRPKDYNAAAGTGALSAATLAWLSSERRYKGLRQYTIPGGADPNSINGACPGNATDADIITNVDQTQMTVLSVVTTLASTYTPPVKVPPAPTANLVLPSGSVPPGGGPGTATGGGGNALDFLGQELLDGSVTDWMAANPYNIFATMVQVAVTVRYTGTDPVVRAMFGQGPIFVKTFLCPVQVTNASTQTYTMLSSSSRGEVIPVGLAQNLYQGLGVLHYQGFVRTVEEECSGAVSMANTLVLTGGKPEWSAMNAQITQIEEHLDTGETTITVGPPKNLTAAQMVDILKASFVRVQSGSLDERLSGVSGSSAPQISTGGSVATTGIVHTPSCDPAKPFACIFQKGAGSTGMQFKINLNSSLFLSEKLNDNVAGTGLNAWTDFRPGNDFVYGEITFDSGNNVVSWTIKSWYTGGTWALDDLPGEYGSGHGAFEYQLTYDAAGNSIFAQYVARFPIYMESSPAQSKPQMLETHLIMKGDLYNGALYTSGDGPATIGIKMPKPYGGFAPL